MTNSSDDSVTVRPARRELEIGNWTFWLNTNGLHVTAHIGTLTTCLLLGYIVGRHAESRGGDGHE